MCFLPAVCRPGSGAGARDPHGGVQQHAGVDGVAGAADAAAAPAARAAGAPAQAPPLHRAAAPHADQVCCTGDNVG